MFDMDHKGNRYREFLTDWKLVQLWCERVRELPDFLISAAVQKVPNELSIPTPAERAELKEFFQSRKVYLMDHIIKWQSYFPGLSKRRRKT
jgi:hypothetical protein